MWKGAREGGREQASKGGGELDLEQSNCTVRKLPAGTACVTAIWIPYHTSTGLLCLCLLPGPPYVLTPSNPCDTLL